MNKLAGLSFKPAEGLQHKTVQHTSAYCLYFLHINVFYVFFPKKLLLQIKRTQSYCSLLAVPQFISAVTTVSSWRQQPAAYHSVQLRSCLRFGGSFYFHLQGKSVSRSEKRQYRERIDSRQLVPYTDCSLTVTVTTPTVP
jgi:hypothetical protein